MVTAHLEAAEHHGKSAIEAFREDWLRDAAEELDSAERALDEARRLIAARGPGGNAEARLDMWHSLLRIMGAQMAAETLATRALEALPDAATANELLGTGWTGPLQAMRDELDHMRMNAEKAPDDDVIARAIALVQVQVDLLTEQYVTLGLLVLDLRFSDEPWSRAPAVDEAATPL